jgi:hypothetical protein
MASFAPDPEPINAPLLRMVEEITGRQPGAYETLHSTSEELFPVTCRTDALHAQRNELAQLVFRPSVWVELRIDGLPLDVFETIDAPERPRGIGRTRVKYREWWPPERTPLGEVGMVRTTYILDDDGPTAGEAWRPSVAEIGGL